MNNIKQKLSNFLDTSTQMVLFTIHNLYCEKAKYPCDQIQINDEEFWNNNFGSPWEAIKAASYNDCNFKHEFVRYNNIGVPETTNDLQSDEWYNTEEIVNYAIDNDYDFENADIRDILDGKDF